MTERAGRWAGRGGGAEGPEAEEAESGRQWACVRAHVRTLSGCGDVHGAGRSCGPIPFSAFEVLGWGLGASGLGCCLEKWQFCEWRLCSVSCSSEGEEGVQKRAAGAETQF